MRRGNLLFLLILATVVVSPLSSACKDVSATRASIDGPGDLVTDSNGHLFVVGLVENKVHRIDLRNGTITTVAGNGKRCCYKDGVRATSVSLEFLRALGVDSFGDIFIGDGGQIREVDARTGLISTVAGDGTGGDTVDGGPALSVHFWGIDGLAIDSHGDLFVADGLQRKIFRIDKTTGIVHAFAGNGKYGFAGDGGLATAASFRWAESIALDGVGDLIIADSENCRIRRIDHDTGIINTIAVTETLQNCLAIGNSNSKPGPFPDAVSADSAGNIYFVEGAMDVVLRIDVQTSAVSTVAGTGHRGFSGDTGPATRAELANPSGLAIDSDGDIFIAEYINNRVRRIDAKTMAITTFAGNGLLHRVDVEL